VEIFKLAYSCRAGLGQAIFQSPLFTAIAIADRRQPNRGIPTVQNFQFNFTSDFIPDFAD